MHLRRLTCCVYAYDSKAGSGQIKRDKNSAAVGSSSLQSITAFNSHKQQGDRGSELSASTVHLDHRSVVTAQPLQLEIMLLSTFRMTEGPSLPTEKPKCTTSHSRT